MFKSIPRWKSNIFHSHNVNCGEPWSLNRSMLLWWFKHTHIKSNAKWDKCPTMMWSNSFIESECNLLTLHDELAVVQEGETHFTFKMMMHQVICDKEVTVPSLLTWMHFFGNVFVFLSHFYTCHKVKIFRSRNHFDSISN